MVFKERDLKSAKTTTVLIKLEDYVYIHLKARRDGQIFDRKFEIVVDIAMISSILSSLAYLNICRDLKITPYRYMTAQRFLQGIINRTDNQNGLSIKMDVSTFHREEKIKEGISLSASSFLVLCMSGNTIISSHMVRINNDINNLALSAAIVGLNKYKVNGYTKAFRMGIFIDNQLAAKTSIPYEFEAMIKKSLNDAFSRDFQNQPYLNIA